MPENKGKILLQIARAAIAEEFGQAFDIKNAIDKAEWLKEKVACFVTLKQNAQLRGCIGTLEAHRPLLEDVKHNARAAAFNDSRFSPLTREELDTIEIEISLLSPMQALNFSNEQQALSQLKPGNDGVVFEFGRYRSTFLPQVWEQLPEPEDFIVHLKNKAGLASNFWDEDVKLYRYSVNKWKESDFAAPSEERAV